MLLPPVPGCREPFRRPSETARSPCPGSCPLKQTNNKNKVFWQEKKKTKLSIILDAAGEITLLPLTSCHRSHAEIPRCGHPGWGPKLGHPPFSSDSGGLEVGGLSKAQGRLEEDGEMVLENRGQSQERQRQRERGETKAERDREKQAVRDLESSRYRDRKERLTDKLTSNPQLSSPKLKPHVWLKRLISP